jgi:hypothetical protein
MKRFTTLAALAVAFVVSGCTDAATAPTARVPAAPTLAVAGLDPVAMPTNVSAAVVGPDSVWFTVRVTFTDNANNDFVTCAKFSGSGDLSACSYDGAAYLGERSFDVKIPAGTYEMNMQARSWQLFNDPLVGDYHLIGRSEVSAPITVVVGESGTITTKRKGRK